MDDRVLIVDRPSGLREGLKAAIEERGAAVVLRDDAMEALAGMRELDPTVVLVGEDPGPPGALHLCRIASRVTGASAVYRLGDPSAQEPLSHDGAFVSRGLGPEAIAAAVLGSREAGRSGGGFAVELAPGQLPQLLMLMLERGDSGNLSLRGVDIEREIRFVRGSVVGAHSSALRERLGAIAVASGDVASGDLDRALDLARERGWRLGEALLELRRIDPPSLWRLLARQRVEQVAAACAGAWQARFVPAGDPAHGGDLLRVHPMTAVARALTVSRPVTTAGFARMAHRPLVAGPPSPHVARWLAGLGLDEPLALFAGKLTLGQMKQRLASVLSAGGPADPEAIALGLLAVGAVRFAPDAGKPAPGHRAPAAPGDLPRALEDAPALELAMPAAPLAPARDDWQRAVDAYLFAPIGTDEVLWGPAVEAEALPAELLAAYLNAHAEPRRLLGIDEDSSSSGIRLAFEARLSEIDQALEGRAEGPLERCRRLELRRVLERAKARALGASPGGANGHGDGAGHDGVISLPPEDLVAEDKLPPLPAALAAPSLRAGRRSSAPPSAEMAELEPLLQQADWQQVVTVLDARAQDERLTSPLALIYALALKETEGRPGEGGSQRASAEALAIRATAELLQVGEESATALVIAKRLLRRRPIEWNNPPRGRSSIFLLLLALIVGAAIGLGVGQKLLALL